MFYDVEVRWSARGRLPEMDQVLSPVQLPADFCFLVSRTDGRPAQPAFAFLAETYLAGAKVRTVRVARNTIKAVCDDLVDFHHYLDANQIEVTDVGDVELEGYLLSMTTLASPVTGRPYEVSTIVRRRSSVARFLAYCQNKGLLKRRFRCETVVSPRGTIQRFAPNLPGPHAEPIDKLVRAIDPRLLSLLLGKLGPPCIDEVEGELRPSTSLATYRLMAEVCLQTGLRRSEVCDLQVRDIEGVAIRGRQPFSAVVIPVVGKGSKRRSVPFPVWLVKALRSYVEEIRASVLRDGSNRNRSLNSKHSFLFVIPEGSRSAKGRPVSPKQFNTKFAEARANLIEELRGTNPELHSVACHSRLTVHALRHTFAILTYIARRDQGDPLPGKYVQSVLGHAYHETTERIYLRSSHAYESELSDLLENLPKQHLS